MPRHGEQRLDAPAVHGDVLHPGPCLETDSVSPQTCVRLDGPQTGIFKAVIWTAPEDQFELDRA